MASPFLTIITASSDPRSEEAVVEEAAALPMLPFCLAPFIVAVGRQVVGANDSFTTERDTVAEAAWYANSLAAEAAVYATQRKLLVAALRDPSSTRIFRVAILNRLVLFYDTAPLAEQACAAINNAFRSWRRMVTYNARGGHHVR